MRNDITRPGYSVKYMLSKKVDQSAMRLHGYTEHGWRERLVKQIYNQYIKLQEEVDCALDGLLV